MDLARVSSKGQITIPVEIRKKLNLKEGDKVLFIEENGKIVLANSSYIALKEMQDAMKDEAEKVGLVSEENVNDLIKDIRKELLEDRNESNDRY
jgi:AbrB family looped-hinge helix DNA binding protein